MASSAAAAEWEQTKAALDAGARETLLRVARTAVEASARDEPPPLPDHAALPKALQRPGAAFVTVRVGGQLRGCIGAIAPRDLGLADTVAVMARAASRDDPRFAAIAPADLPDLEVEISVLGPLLPAVPGDIVVGRDGLVIEQGARRGLLLPQVAIEWGFDREAFLAQACVKAGLGADAWRRGARVLRFEAEVFGEGPGS